MKIFQQAVSHLKTKWLLRTWLALFALYFIYLLVEMYTNGSVSIRGVERLKGDDSGLFETRALKYKVYTVVLIYFSLLKKYKKKEV